MKLSIPALPPPLLSFLFLPSEKTKENNVKRKVKEGGRNIGKQNKPTASTMLPVTRTHRKEEE